MCDSNLSTSTWRIHRVGTCQPGKERGEGGKAKAMETEGGQMERGGEQLEREGDEMFGGKRSWH